GTVATAPSYNYGRLANVQYGVFAAAQTIAETYSYHPAGAVMAKSMQVGSLGAMTVNYTYNQAGRVWTMQYPSSSFSKLTYGYDAMGRLNSLAGAQTLVPAAQYDLAGRMSSIQYLAGASGGCPTLYTQETMAYNVNGRLSSLNWGNPNGTTNGCNLQYLSVGPMGSIQYNYSATQNNGQIAGVVDSLSGETIGYQYDALKRLTSASSTPNS